MSGKRSVVCCLATRPLCQEASAGRRGEANADSKSTPSVARQTLRGTSFGNARLGSNFFMGRLHLADSPCLSKNQHTRWVYCTLPRRSPVLFPANSTVRLEPEPAGLPMFPSSLANACQSLNAFAGAHASKVHCTHKVSQSRRANSLFGSYVRKLAGYASPVGIVSFGSCSGMVVPQKRSSRQYIST